MTIAELKKRAKEHNDKIHELTGRIAQLTEMQKEADAAAQSAAEAGDIEKFKAASADAAELTTELIVCRAQYKKLNSITAVSKEEADSAWKSYVSEYKREFDKLSSEFEKKRKAMLDAYNALFELQTAACETRESLAECSGINTKRTSMYDNPFEQAFPCDTMLSNGYKDQVKVNMQGTTSRCADAVYYLANFAKTHNLSGIELLKDGEFHRINNILSFHTTKGF